MSGLSDIFGLPLSVSQEALRPWQFIQWGSLASHSSGSREVQSQDASTADLWRSRLLAGSYMTGEHFDITCSGPCRIASSHLITSSQAPPSNTALLGVEVSVGIGVRVISAQSTALLCPRDGELNQLLDWGHSFLVCGTSTLHCLRASV